MCIVRAICACTSVLALLSAKPNTIDPGSVGSWMLSMTSWFSLAGDSRRTGHACPTCIRAEEPCHFPHTGHGGCPHGDYVCMLPHLFSLFGMMVVYCAAEPKLPLSIFLCSGVEGVLLELRPLFGILVVTVLKSLNFPLAIFLVYC